MYRMYLKNLRQVLSEKKPIKNLKNHSYMIFIYANIIYV